MVVLFYSTGIMFLRFVGGDDLFADEIVRIESFFTFLAAGCATLRR